MEPEWETPELGLSSLLPGASRPHGLGNGLLWALREETGCLLG